MYLQKLKRQANGQKAFTLAEVLITLAIIGVVAAVTMPTLIQQYKERETVARVNQFYSMFSQAYQMAILEHGTFDQWGLKAWGDTIQNEDGSYRYSDNAIESSNKFFEIMSKYLKYVSYTPFTTDPISDPNGISNAYMTKEGVQLANGIAIRMAWINSENACKTSNRCGDIYFVTDAGPLSEKRADGNVYRRKQTFAFMLEKDKIVPPGADNNIFKQYCLPGNSNVHCTGWVIKNKNMDYLHCNDLDMNKKTKCK